MGDVLAGAGLFAAAAAAAAAMVWAPSTRRSAAMLLALALIPTLILADQWNSAEVTDLREDGARFALLAVLSVGVVIALTLVFRRRPLLLPLTLIAAIPFRVPIEAGGQDANLLIPLYLAIAGGVLATAWGVWEQRRRFLCGWCGGAGPRSRGPGSTFGGRTRRDRTRSRARGSSAVTGPAVEA